MLGAVLSLGAFLQVRAWDEKRAELDLTLQAQAAASAVRGAGEVSDELLHNLAELMGRRGDLSRAEFAEVTRPLLARNPELRALDWAPVVRAAEWARVEEQARRELGRPFEFTQPNGTNAPQRTGERAFYWPVLYVEPVAGNEMALGLDLVMGFNQAAHDFAGANADLVLSHPLWLVQEPERQLSYMAIMPVYRGGGVPAAGPERAPRLAGFVHGLFRAGDFLREAMQDAPPTRLDLMALDVTPGSPERLIHFLPAKDSAPMAVPTEAEMRAGWHVALPLTFGERKLALLFRPTPGALAALRTVNHYGALVSGWLLTVVCASYLHTVLRRTARVTAEVAERTAALTMANRQLSDEIAARQREQQALVESEARFRALFESSPDAVFVESSEGIVLDANHGACQLHGLTREELLGKHVTELVPPARRETVRQNFAELFTHQITVLESESFTKDGRIIPIELAARPFEYGGRVAALIHVRDISVRRRYEQELRESEARFRLLFDRSPDAIFVEDLNGVILDVNPAGCALHGVTRAELLGKNARDTMPPDQPERVLSNLPAMEALGGSYFESRSQRADGTAVPVELAVSRCEFGGVPAIIIHARDISGRRRAEAALARRDRILHAVAQAARTLLHAQDWQTVAPETLGELGEATGCSAVCLFANGTLEGEPAFCGLCVWPPSEPLANGGAPISYGASGCSRWRDLLSRGESVYGHVRVFPAAERRVPEAKGMKSIALTPIFAGSVWWGFLALGQRETERDWFTGELEALRAAAEVFGAAIARAEVEAARVRFEARLQETQKLESLGVLAGGIAHDFNNLLTSILGNASLARLDLPPHSPANHSLERIETASLRAADLCKQMLAYAGKGRLVVQPVNLTQLVQETAHLLQVSISKRAVLKFDLAPNLPAVLVDASQLRQIVMNLVINASEAIGERSGVIALATGLVRADREYLADSRLAGDLSEGDYVFLEASDTGCGMTPEIQARIFEPFFTTKFTGRGLGLAAVLGIVRGHRGALKVDSVPGKGSTFRLLLPVTHELAQPTSGPNPLATGWRGHGRILVVDDEETVRTVVARVLENLGFTVTLASDGREAVKIFEAQPDAFTMVVVDLTMPHMDGTEAFARMRRVRPDLRVVLMSGYSEPDATLAFAGKGLAGFLQKPFELIHLHDKVRAVFEMSK
ncbi:MAG: PAS domain S-box protein [Proteobacteria bacterium]|nr:PAS domain S-box protein [Verrucomicrobiota bacterium]NBU09395.1 PAS domain S-box protein [Pseudomonadota bacterium]